MQSREALEPALASCLCVTEDRPEFLSWLLWNYRKQDYERRELVVVDSSREPLALPDDPSVRVVTCVPGTSVARKRNLALDAARGTFVTWFDDDDWQHPRKLSILAAALERGAVLAGSSRGWFIDLGRLRARPYEARRSLIFNGVAVRRSALDGVRFDERRSRAADTAWVSSIRRSARDGVQVAREVLSCWLCHRRNVSNPATRYVFPHPVAEVSRAVGAADWGDTDEELERLRDGVENFPTSGCSAYPKQGCEP
jgi:glycosyltransferase involved in cell wall biosynthesis